MIFGVFGLFARFCVLAVGTAGLNVFDLFVTC